MNNGFFLFRVKSPSGVSQILSIDPAFSITQLRSKIAELFKCPEDSFDLFSGFPPQRLECPDSDSIQSVLKSNSALLINSKSSATAIGALSSNPPKSPVNGNNHSSSSSSGSGGGRGNIRTLSSPVPSSGTNAVRRRTKVSASSQEDIADHLIAAVGGGSAGAATDKRSVALRRVFRNAVQRQYKTTLSTARQGAGLSGQFTLSESANVRVLGSSEVRRVTVTFKAGLTARAQHSETIDLIPKELIKTVLEEALSDAAGHGRELLKPENLSFASPRIFWSLIYFYGRDMQATFASLFPECTDWSWLDERKRELSEKAQLNIDQQRERMRQRMLQQQERASRKRSKEVLLQSPVIDLTAGDSAAGHSTMSVETPEPRVAKKARVSAAAGRDSPFTTPGASSAGAGDTRFFALVKSAGLARLRGRILPARFEQPLLKTLTRVDPVAASALTLANCLTDAGYHASYDSLIEQVADEVTSAKIEKASQYHGEEDGVDDERDQDEEVGADEELSQSLVDEWIAEARDEVYKMAWCFLCGGQSRLRRALTRAHVTSPALLGVWRMAPEALLQTLLSLDPHLEKLIVRRLALPPTVSVSAPVSATSAAMSTASKARGKGRPPVSSAPATALPQNASSEFSRLNADAVRDMCVFAHSLLAQPETHWFEDLCAADMSDDEDEGEDEAAVDNTTLGVSSSSSSSDAVGKNPGGVDAPTRTQLVGEDGWLFAPDSHPLLGARVRCYMDEGGASECEAHVEAPLRWYEDGTVVGHLPATEEEPMALWRVCLDSSADDPLLGVTEVTVAGSGRKLLVSQELRARAMARVARSNGAATARCEDLEEHEVLAAAQRAYLSSKT